MLFCVREQKAFGRLYYILLFFVGRLLSLSQPKPALAAVNAASQKISAVNQEFVSWMGNSLAPKSALLADG